MARYYLSNSVLELNEAAYLLGFEDPNSFGRAFRTWEGEPQAIGVKLTVALPRIKGRAGLEDMVLVIGERLLTSALVKDFRIGIHIEC